MFGLFKKDKSSKFKDIQDKKEEKNDELTEEELEHVGGNYNHLEFEEMKRIKEEVEEDSNPLRR